MILRALVGALAAGVVATLARRAGSLTAGGRWAAFLTGTLVAAAGWRWAALLVGYFAASALLTRFGRDKKIARTESVLPPTIERNAIQVAANGGLFALAVVVGEVTLDTRWFVAGIGALAAAAADTWASELGTLWGGQSRSILTGVRLPTGFSGGITAVGIAAAALAAGIMAIVSEWLIPPALDPTGSLVTAIFAAGLGGSVIDSVLGATVQSKRWCDQCRTWTERRVHTCQYRSLHARGLRWMTNDTVNFLATLAGALIALSLVGPLD